MTSKVKLLAQFHSIFFNSFLPNVAFFFGRKFKGAYFVFKENLKFNAQEA